MQDRLAGISMKKLDKLILKSFFGPFFLTFCVVVFIFLLQFLLRHFDDIVGKGLSWDVYVRLLGYFSINMTPVSFPLAVLLSSLMTYGNLGEHSEITALKSAGISLTRTLIPMFVFSVFLTFVAYLSNNYFVPKANLKAYSLLYDIRQKAPALNIKEGVFYKDIPGYQIKVNKKFKDGKSLKDVIIYNHTSRSGNKEVILADSGRMYTILNDRYLVMELFDGHHYSEQQGEVRKNRRPNTGDPEPFSRAAFDHSKFVFSMASFDLKRTKEELFAGHRLMKNTIQLKQDIDSMSKDVKFAKFEAFNNLKNKFNYHLDRMEIPSALEPAAYGRQKQQDSTRTMGQKDRSGTPRTAFSKNVDISDSLREIQAAAGSTAGRASQALRKKNRQIIRNYPAVQTGTPKRKSDAVQLALNNMLEKQQPLSETGADSLLTGHYDDKRVLTTAVTNARFVKNHIMVTTSKVTVRNHEIIRFRIQRNKIIAQAFSCLIMFLIGAPLGSIIKRGGFGFPVIVSIGFFIIYYVFMSIGEKWAKEAFISPIAGVWLANIVLLPFGLFFLRQARLDARLFDMDFYNVFIQKIQAAIPENIKKRKLFILFNR